MLNSHPLTSSYGKMTSKELDDTGRQLSDRMTQAILQRRKRLDYTEHKNYPSTKAPWEALSRAGVKPSWKDHTRCWRSKKPNMPLFWTSEPYELTREVLEHMESTIDQTKWAYKLSAQSPYFPGRTIQIAFVEIKHRDMLYSFCSAH